MITGKNFYEVLSALVPLYVTMILAYGSVKWWKIFTPEQCSGINHFVAVVAIPFFSFKFIYTNNPYDMNLKLLAADSLQKLVVLVAIGLWQIFDKHGKLDWKITLFSLTTLPNTLVIGVPLLGAMYGEATAPLMIQIVVLQCIVWYTVMLVLFEYRAAKALIAEQFPHRAASIASIKVESDVVSLDSRQLLEADSEAGEDGKLRVILRKSNSTRSCSNLTGADLFSLNSFEEPIQTTPRSSCRNTRFVHNSWRDDLNHASSCRGERMKSSNFEKEKMVMRFGRSKSSNFVSGMNLSCFSPVLNKVQPMSLPGSSGIINNPEIRKPKEVATRDLHMFVWTSSASLTSEDSHNPGPTFSHLQKESSYGEKFAHRVLDVEGSHTPDINVLEATSNLQKITEIEGCAENETQMPPVSVMTRLILIMVCRKLIRNPNTYASVIGLVWSLLSFRWDFEMPKILANSIKIISDVGLGMAMFSLGLFMALQPKIIACGKSPALLSMVVRFLAGPLVMAATSFAIGIRGNLLRISILQAALPQGIVPFVYAKEYNVHPQLLSTTVIFGMIIALPILIVYYILLGL